MKLFRIVASLILLAIFFNSCNDKETNKSIYEKIDVEYAFANKGNLKLNQLIDSITYIPLETNEDCILPASSRCMTSNQYIIVNGFRRIYLFKKSTGEFKKEIGKYEKSPFGYRYTLNTIPYLENSNLILAADWDKSYCAYDFSGSKCLKIKPPKGVTSVAFLNDSVFVGYYYNIEGTQKKKITTFNKDGEIFKTFPNYLSYKKDPNSFYYNGAEGMFFKCNENMFFKEVFNDTIFHVKKNELTPRAIFKMGKFSPPYEKKEILVKVNKHLNGVKSKGLDNYFKISNLCESSRFILFQIKYKAINYFGYYDKVKKKTYVTENIISTLSTKNGLLPFKLNRAYINSNNELICQIQAFELVKWFEDNPEKVAKLAPQLRDLKKIKKEDNSVVLIVKLKN